MFNSIKAKAIPEAEFIVMISILNITSDPCLGSLSYKSLLCQVLLV